MAATIDRLYALIDGWVHDGVVPGVALAVARRGELVAERYGGKTAAGGGAGIDAGTLFPLGALTMPFTATAYLRLVERGIAALDEPVRRYLPGFGAGTGSDAAARRELSPRDLLTHTAGLPAEDPGAAKLALSGATFDEWVASAATLPLEHQPGNRLDVSAPGYWLLGGAVAAAAGASFAEVLKAEVLDRFGLKETFLTPPDAVADRIARRYGRDRIVNTAYGRRLGSPAGGLFATARDLVHFASIFLAGGRDAAGQPLLSTASVGLMTTGQAGPLPGVRPGQPEASQLRWGLGWEVKGPVHGHWAGDLTPDTTFGHVGEPGVCLWADPATGLAAAVLANRELSTGWTLSPARWARLANAVVAALANE